MHQFGFGLSEQAHQIRTLSKSYGKLPTPVVRLLKTRTKHSKGCQDLPAIHVSKASISPNRLTMIAGIHQLCLLLTKLGF
jgi:hypothetical protein